MKNKNINKFFAAYDLAIYFLNSLTETQSLFEYGKYDFSFFFL